MLVIAVYTNVQNNFNIFYIVNYTTNNKIINIFSE